MARNHYNCQSLTGVELEDNGGSGSASSHFERMSLFNEMMTASSFKDSSYSNFTLALLYDTGWYDLDFSLAEHFYFGKNKGCSIICIKNIYKKFVFISVLDFYKTIFYH